MKCEKIDFSIFLNEGQLINSTLEVFSNEVLRDILIEAEREILFEVPVDLPPLSLQPNLRKDPEYYGKQLKLHTQLLEGSRFEYQPFFLDQRPELVSFFFFFFFFFFFKKQN